MDKTERSSSSVVPLIFPIRTYGSDSVKNGGWGYFILNYTTTGKHRGLAQSFQDFFFAKEMPWIGKSDEGVDQNLLLSTCLP